MKELGAYQQHNMLEAMETYTMALMTRFMGWTADQVRAFLVGVREEILNRKIHMYSKVYFVYGQKPQAQCAYGFPLEKSFVNLLHLHDDSSMNAWLFAFFYSVICMRYRPKYIPFKQNNALAFRGLFFINYFTHYRTRENI